MRQKQQQQQQMVMVRQQQAMMMQQQQQRQQQQMMLGRMATPLVVGMDPSIAMQQQQQQRQGFHPRQQSLLVMSPRRSQADDDFLHTAGMVWEPEPLPAPRAKAGAAAGGQAAAVPQAKEVVDLLDDSDKEEEGGKMMDVDEETIVSDDVDEETIRIICHDADARLKARSMQMLVMVSGYLVYGTFTEVELADEFTEASIMSFYGD